MAHWESCRERVEDLLAVNDPDKFYRELEKYAEGTAEEKRRREEEAERRRQQKKEDRRRQEE